MNMMTMSKMEEAVEQAWDKHGALQAVFRKHTSEVYGDGFRAGAAWAQSQQKSEGSSQAVGNISQYPAAVEEPEEEA